MYVVMNIVGTSSFRIENSTSRVNLEFLNGNCMRTSSCALQRPARPHNRSSLMDLMDGIVPNETQ